MVSAEVKNAGRDIEVNAINTVFGRDALSEVHEELIYTAEKITPEQQTLLNGNNPRQYSAEREQSESKDNVLPANGQGNVVEYYYPETGLRRAEGKPLADIVRAIQQSLYSGEFKDTTGLAQRQEVNAEQVAAVNAKLLEGREETTLPDEWEKGLRDGLVDTMRGAGIDVVTDEAEGQRVLDEANGRGYA